MKGDYDKIKAMDAEVLALSVDSVHTNRVFASSLGGMPYPFLGDIKKEVARAFGVLSEQRGTATRSVFIIDKDGIIRYKKRPFDVRSHEEYQEVLDELARV